MKKADAYSMKQINLNLLWRVMKQCGSATKPQLASMTGLSVVTINSLVKDLVETGELIEDEITASNGGRPALTYRFNYDFSLALVIHMNEQQGKDVVNASVVNLNEEVLKQEKYSYLAFELSSLIHLIDQILIEYHSIKVIGIGIPGQSVDGVITVTSHGPLHGMRLMEEIKTAFGLPVILENDVNAAISGYAYRADLPDDLCIAGIYFPEKYPPGMGIFLDGKVIKGKKGMAGEIKFLPIHVDWLQPLNGEVFTEIACRVLQSVNAVLAPDQIVIYKEQLDHDEFINAWNKYVLIHDFPSCPEIVLIPTVDEDFVAGMKWLTLKELEPKHLEFK
ncbi:ROK family protein [Neobacillus mesonae]|nr:ROK family protein [Neobacillus mesonae]